MVLLSDSANAGQRLDLFLHEKLPEFSRARLQEWIKHSRVLVDGQARKASSPLRGGERVEVEPEALTPLKATAEDLPLTVLYEDDDVIAVDKPAGMVVHSGAGHSSGTLVNALLHHFGTLSSVGGDLRPGIVHRLDRYTSGVLLVARHDRAHRHLATQFASRTTHKTYLALVHGVVKEDHGRIEKPIARDPSRRIRMTARLRTGRFALTEYRVLRRFQKFTLLEVDIHTGRTHQIRVHLSGLGYPVVGDRLYGAPAKIEGLPDLGRFFLHARRIVFTQPSTGASITVEAPLPAELEQWMDRLL